MNTIEKCLSNKQYHLAKVICYIQNQSEKYRYLDRRIKVKILCNWCDSISIHNLWKKMLPLYSKIILTEDNPDFYIVINSTVEYIEKSRTILFRMEPNMNNNIFSKSCVGVKIIKIINEKSICFKPISLISH